MNRRHTKITRTSRKNLTRTPCQSIYIFESARACVIPALCTHDKELHLNVNLFKRTFITKVKRSCQRINKIVREERIVVVVRILCSLLPYVTELWLRILISSHSISWKENCKGLKKIERKRRNLRALWEKRYIELKQH